MLELPIVQLLAASAEPMGAASVRSGLTRQGFSISEPSVGRYLRDLEQQGLAVQISNRGRVLTAAGRSHFAVLQGAESREAIEARLRRELKPSNVDDILDILAVRRSLERESCRAAAHRASGDQVKALRDYIVLCGPAGDMPGFHSYLAAASGNKVLATLVDLLTREEALHPALRGILEVQGSLRDTQFHEAVVRAIEVGDPDAAESALLQHLDAMIDAVRRYRTSSTTAQDPAHDDGMAEEPRILIDNA